MSAADNPITVVNNPDEERYEARVDGALAFLAYSRHGDRIVLIHTEVPPEIEGRGVAAALARYALDEARAQGWTVIPSCPYVASYIRRHPDYLPLVAESWRERLERPTP
jgi:predicted GNAT family acetyltransferase